MSYCSSGAIRITGPKERMLAELAIDRTKDLRNNRSSFNEPKTGTA